MSDTSTTVDNLELAAGAQPNEHSEPAWPAIVSLSLGVFGLVTAEFLPASLLTPIAADLGISDGAAGQAVTATAVVGAISAPTLAILTGNIDRRLVLWTLTLMLVLSNLIAASATGLTQLLVARVILGICLGGFWSMAAALAMRLVPMRLLPRAMSIVLTGVSVATVSAAPAGAYIGALLGWRWAFLIATAIAAFTLAIQMATMPKLPPVAVSSLGALIDLLKRPSMRIALVAVLLVISGHFAGFTYVRPFLEQVPVLDVEAISLVLLAFGIAGFFGNFAGGFVAERNLRLAVGLGATMIALTSLAMFAVGASPLLSAVSVAIWGFAFSWLPVGFQTWMVRAAPDQAEGAGGLLVTAFQVAIAGGAILGGLLVNGFGPLGAVFYCGLAALTGAGLVFMRGSTGTVR